MASTPRATGTTTIALTVAAVVIIAALGTLVLSGQFRANPTNTSSSNLNSKISTGAASENTSASFRAMLLSACSQGKSPNSSFWNLAASSNQAAVVCLQVYYYDPTAPTTINVTSALSIEALQYIANGSTSYPRSFNGASNFTVAASQSQLIIGGPNNENEGTTIVYAITAKSGASGTYQLGFLSYPGMGGNSWMLNPQEPLRCGYYGELVTGNGQPNYAQLVDLCITYATYNSSTPGPTSTTTSHSSTHTVSGISYPLQDDFVYFEETDVSNSTQLGSIV